MADSGLTWCPEIEGAAPCKFFEVDDLNSAPLCPGCFAFGWYPLRRSRYNDGQTTPKKGLIRLGTWREIIATDYEAFLAGRGTTPDGKAWERSDFPRRNHFVITRGLEDWSLYDRMLRNDRCLNVQVSVDILVTAQGVQQIPGDERLRQFLEHPKVLFRLKPLAEPAADRGITFLRNVEHFVDLCQRLGIPRLRVLETPLRLDGNRTYGSATPLELAGWEPESFWRCNTECKDCPGKNGQGENRFLVCAATERTLQMMEHLGNIRPKRLPPAAKPKLAWTDVTLGAWRQLGGTANLQDLYRVVVELEPRLAERPHYQAKVRAIVQAHGQRLGRGLWCLKAQAPSIPEAAVEA